MPGLNSHCFIAFTACSSGRTRCRATATLHVTDRAIVEHDRASSTVAFDPVLPRLVGVAGLDLLDDLWQRDAVARLIDLAS